MANKRQKKKNASRGDKYLLRYYRRTVIAVEHRGLKRFSSNSVFKRECPRCKEGVLLVRRDPTTGVLQDHDRCMLCGQHFRYTDMEHYRQMERGR